MRHRHQDTRPHREQFAWKQYDTDLSARSVMERCDRIAAFTDTPGSITRLFLSDAAARLQAELRHWMEAANLTVRVDNAGNLIARRPAFESTASTQTLLIGSHLDTVPNAGRYDGILGVMIGLQAIEALGETPLPFHIDLIGFSEEEGVRFGVPYIGSAAVAGCFDYAWLGRCDPSGQSLGHVIEERGLKPSRIKDDAYQPDQVLGYTEVHLEQGPVLDSLDLPLGVVTGIQGQSRLMLRYTGHADHAGTVPMEHRRDALLAASRVVVAAADYARGTDGLRATVGYIKAEPNVRNVVPGVVEQSLDIRHADDDIRVKAVTQLIATAEQIAAEENVKLRCRSTQQQGAMQTDPGLSSALSKAIEQAGMSPYALPSGAGHDAVVMARLAPTAMLFVRHPKGVSHHPEETVLAEDAGRAVQVLAQYIVNLSADAAV
ncbi:MAG: allantoate amidohydrolase [Planctomycetota bacterium]